MCIGTRKTSSVSNGTGSKDTIAGLLASLMEVVRTTVACECVYVRAMVIKALIWMQSPHDSFDELESIIASELSDPAWPATLLNDILLTLHARFKVCMDIKSYFRLMVWNFCCKAIFLMRLSLIIFSLTILFSAYCNIEPISLLLIIYLGDKVVTKPLLSFFFFG